MKGLELARRYYSEVVLPAFIERAPGKVDSMNFGLAGPGSECYGYDDEISRDHDWGPRVCIWIPENLYKRQSGNLQTIYDGLNHGFLGFDPVKRLDNRIRKDGILSTARFYGNYLGSDRPPETLRDWLLMPEEALSLCSNGEVFREGSGDFMTMREVLLSYFPRDIRLKKIASRCKAAAQHGQYNLWRAFQRNDLLAVQFHKAGFTHEAASLVFLLCRIYRPFGKWIFRGLDNLGTLGSDVKKYLRNMTESNDEKEIQGILEGCAGVLADELVRQDLTPRKGSFLYDYGVEIERSIEDVSLREELDSIG